ncbi:unnamed protein product [Brassica rapa subsp. trilocularis]
MVSRGKRREGQGQGDLAIKERRWGSCHNSIKTGFGQLPESESQATSVPDIEYGFRARIAGPPPASPIEDRGTAIPIEDRDQVIPERLRLCGVIVKGLPVFLMWRKNDSVGA